MNVEGPEAMNAEEPEATNSEEGGAPPIAEGWKSTFEGLKEAVELLRVLQPSLTSTSGARVMKVEIYSPELAPLGDRTHASSRVPITSLSQAELLTRCKNIKAREKEVVKMLKREQLRHNSFVDQLQQGASGGDVSMALGKAIKLLLELASRESEQRLSTYVEAEAVIAESWPPYLKGMLRDLSLAVKDRTLDPQIHPVLVEMLSAIGKHRSYGPDSASNTRWRAYTHLQRLLGLVCSMRGSRRIMGLLSGAGHQGEGKTGKKRLCDAKENLHLPGFNSCFRQLKDSGALNGLTKLGVQSDAIRSLSLAGRESFGIRGSNSSRTRIWLQFDSTDIRPSVIIGFDPSSGLLHVRWQHSLTLGFEPEGSVTDPKDVSPLLRCLNSGLKQVLRVQVCFILV